MAEEGVKLQTKGRVQCAVSTEVDGDIFSFRGGSTGIVKILEPVSPLLNYFEYLILDRGREASIGIGVGERNYPTGRMPGWNRNSCGYHADDGKLYHENGMGRAFGPTCTNGDRMGCGVDFDTDCGPDHVNIFFTKNGRQVGEPVRMKKPIYGLYPLIGLHSRGERVHYLGHWQRTADGSTEPMEQDNSPGSAWLRCNQVRFLDDGLTVEYAGHGGDVQDIGIAQARFPIDRTNHYFEMEILGTGTHGALAIGLAKTTYPLHRHPGWNAGAVGYHADDGKLFVEKGHGDPFGPTCTEGDTMGCGIQFSPCGAEEAERWSSGSEGEDEDEEEEEEEEYFEDEEDLFSSPDSDYSDDFLGDMLPRGLRPPRRALLRAMRPALRQQKSRERAGPERTCTVYFTKNGEKIGETECKVPSGGFYPVVAMLSRGEKLRANFQPLSG